jgi:putative SOS response-associated peptidase YedK
MCGRFVRTSPADVIRAEFGVTSMAEIDSGPRYNVCPGEAVAAIVQRGHERRLGELSWGLGPRAQINVRSESAARQPLSRDAFRRRRCLVVADGFYEWQQRETEKLPYFFRLASRQPFAFAAIWSRDGATARPQTAILTRPADDLVARVHDRMPVIFGPQARERWLDPSLDDPALLETLLREPGGRLESYRVSTLVNSARNDSPECIRPAEGPLRLVPRAD